MEELIKQTDSVYMTETLFDGQAEQGVELDHVLPGLLPGDIQDNQVLRHSPGDLNGDIRRKTHAGRNCGDPRAVSRGKQQRP